MYPQSHMDGSQLGYQANASQPGYQTNASQLGYNPQNFAPDTYLQQFVQNPPSIGGGTTGYASSNSFQVHGLGSTAPPTSWQGQSKYGGRNGQQGGRNQRQFGSNQGHAQGRQWSAPQMSGGNAVHVGSGVGNFQAAQPPQPYRQQQNRTSGGRSSFGGGGYQQRQQQPQQRAFGFGQSRGNPILQPVVEGVQGYLPKLYCDDCHVTVFGQVAFKQHLESAAHMAKKQRGFGATPWQRQKPTNVRKGAFNCELCNVTVETKGHFDAHIQGRPHQNTVDRMRRSGQSIPEHLDVKNKDAAAVDEDAEDVVGAEYVEEVRNNAGIVTGYVCKLCECEFPGANSKRNHLTGRRHRLQYQTKVDASLKVDSEETNGKDKRMAEIDVSNFRGPIYNHPYYQQPAATKPGGYRPSAERKVDDRHVLHLRHSLQPSKDQLQQAKHVMTLVENTLKTVSDRLFELAKEEQYKFDIVENKAQEPERVLTGVVRVGHFSKRLVLASDSQIEAVVLSKKPPTHKLLKQIIALFQQESDASEVSLEERPDQSGFAVSVSGMDIKCLVTLTSPSLREGDDEEAAAGADAATTPNVAKVADALPNDPCLKALAELRHDKWFQAKYAALLDNAPGTLRVLRGMRMRLPKWICISDWALEVLVEKVLSSAGQSIGPSASLLRVLEVLASGILLNKDYKLADPCEKEPVDVFVDISAQDREDITASAQLALRQVAFNQIHKPLGMDGPVTELFPGQKLDRKRPLPDGNAEDDEASSAKKEKEDDEPKMEIITEETDEENQTAKEETEKESEAAKDEVEKQAVNEEPQKEEEAATEQVKKEKAGDDAEQVPKLEILEGTDASS